MKSTRKSGAFLYIILIKNSQHLRLHSQTRPVHNHERVLFNTLAAFSSGEPTDLLSHQLGQYHRRSRAYPPLADRNGKR